MFNIEFIYIIYLNPEIYKILGNVINHCDKKSTCKETSLIDPTKAAALRLNLHANGGKLNNATGQNKSHNAYVEA